MFFSLTNSPATFQTMMDALFDNLVITGNVIIYMDNVAGPTWPLTHLVRHIAPTILHVPLAKAMYKSFMGQVLIR